MADGIGGGRAPGLDAEFGEEVGDVGTDGTRADVERRGDVAVGKTLGEQAEDLTFAYRQTQGGRWIVRRCRCVLRIT